MVFNDNFKNIKNRGLFLFTSLLLYFTLYVIISSQIKGLYNPIIGSLMIIFSVVLDHYLTKKRIRAYLRFLIVVVVYLILNYLIVFFSFLSSPPDGYHLLVDKLPYIFNRDTIVALLLILFYFIFNSSRLFKTGSVLYYISTIVIVAAFFVFIRLDLPIRKTLFKNYFNLSFFLIFLITVLLIRHISFYSNKIGKKLGKKELLLLLPIVLLLALLFFTIILPKHIEDEGGGGSGLLNENLFMFDFSNFLELKDEIKLNDERVLILELEGVKDRTRNQINKGWNRQIYLKRFALEKYVTGGNFKMAEENIDPLSPPNYFSGFLWNLKNVPLLKSRSEIIETLYLVNIDASSLMGSDLLTGVVPLTKWENSPYKNIYRSYCSIFDSTYSDLLSEEMSQKEYLKKIDPERKKMLLERGGKNKDDKIYLLSKSITGGFDDPFYKALVIQEYLRDNYYYSLKPGVARDGNQLEYFLFDSKKGYCTYFAFAMTLMLRSVGIPARVAVGFAPDMNEKTLNFYDVRSLHAHAWVEVYFDDYGWLTFDPTSSNFAPGENYEMFFGQKEERDDLIEEIIKNKDKLKEIKKEKVSNDFLNELTNKLKRSVRWIGLLTFIGIFFILLFLIYLKKNIYFFKYSFTNDKRKKIIYLYRDILGMLVDFGYPIAAGETLLEYAKRLKDDKVIDIVGLTELYQRSLFQEKNEIDISEKEIEEKMISLKNEMKKKDMKKKIKAFFNISRLWKKIIPIILILFFFNAITLYSQDDYKSIDDYMDEAEYAIDEGYYDQALKTLKEAEELFPDSYRPNFERGKLYYNYQLFENAAIELLKAKEKGNKYDEENYLYLANAYSSLGEDKKAVAIYEEAFKYIYPTETLYSSISWLYFKTHNFNKAIEKIKEALEEYPDSYSLLMTLATLYSSVYDYNNSKKFYLEAIERSLEKSHTSSFRAIAYYNLSLLESSFLFYENAYSSALESINCMNRSSAHLQLNYLYMGALELKKSYDEINTAMSREPSTKFPELSLIYIYILAGRLDEAIKMTKELLLEKDFSWMIYFGTTKDLYDAELYRDLSQAYEFKSNQISFNDEYSLRNNLKRPFLKIYYNVLSFYYNVRGSNIFIKVGEEKIKGGNKLEGLNQLFYGYERTWPGKAYKVLELAQKIEEKNNPQKDRIYNIRKVIMKKKNLFFSYRKNREILLNNINKLDKRWEKEVLLDAALKLVETSYGRQRDNFIEELFMILPSSLPMNNFKIKMNVEISGNKFLQEYKNKIIKQLGKRGINYNADSHFKLKVDLSPENNVIVNYYDNGKELDSFIIKIDKNDKKFYEKVGLEIFNKIFIVQLQ